MLAAMPTMAPALLAGLALIALTLTLLRRGVDPSGVQALDAVSRTLGQLQAELARVVRAQDELRRDVQAGRESSLKELAQATQGLRGEIGQAQKALAEVKAIEQGRARQMDQAADSLKRLEAVVAGSATRGAAGEIGRASCRERVFRVV